MQTFEKTSITRSFKDATLSTLSSITFISYMIAMAMELYNTATSLTEQITLMARRRGFRGGGGMGSTAGANNAKALLIVVILVLLIPAVALIFTGPTSASTGVYGNSTVSAAARNGVVSFSQFIGIILILGAVGVILAIV